MSLFLEDNDQETFIANIRAAVDELSRISFDPRDYLDEIPREILMTRFYNFIQKRIDRRVGHICSSIGETHDIDIREGLYQSLLAATDSFDSPHDEWSRDTAIVNGKHLTECSDVSEGMFGISNLGLIVLIVGTQSWIAIHRNACIPSS